MTDYVRYHPHVPTTASLIGGLVFSLDEVSFPLYFFNEEPYQAKELCQLEITQTKYQIKNTHRDFFQKIETIHKFSANLLENIEDLDPEFSKVIDENYWDLI
jgi:glutamate synthase domain-containing protein 3